MLRKVQLWDTATGEERAVLDKSEWVERGEAVLFSPDGRTLVTAAKGGRINLWDMATYQLRYSFQGHPERVRCLAFSPDGGTLACGGPGSVSLWQADPYLWRWWRPAFAPDRAWR